jgi:hypothetical protein
MRVTTGFAGVAVGTDIGDPVGGGLAPPAGVTAPWRPGAGLITAVRRLPSLGALGSALLREAAQQWDRVLLWTPVAFGLGAAEIFSSSSGWRIVWSQPLRGVRPWTLSGNGG